MNLSQHLVKRLTEINQSLDETLICLTMNREGCDRRTAQLMVERQVRRVVAQHLLVSKEN